MAGKVGKIEIVEDELFCDNKTLCYLLGLTHGRIAQMDTEGKIARYETPAGKLYKTAEVVQDYIDNLKQDDADMIVFSRKKEKAEANYKDAKAKLMQLEVNEVKGQLHRSSDVQVITEDYLYAIRDLLMNLPGQLATDVAVSDNPAECAAIVRTAVNQILLEMTQYSYDPTKYEARVRERRKWEAKEEDGDDDDV